MEACSILEIINTDIICPIYTEQSIGIRYNLFINTNDLEVFDMRTKQEMAEYLIVQNQNKMGDNKLLSRARMIAYSEKIKRHYHTNKGHSLMEIGGSNGETYEVWFFDSGKIHCTCSFFGGLDPFERQGVGCKHLLVSTL